MSEILREHLSKIGSKGGAKSRRTLSPEQARDMVRVREARRAYRRFHVQCFWSSNPDYKVSITDIDWVIQRLRTYGGKDGWEVATRLGTCP